MSRSWVALALLAACKGPAEGTFVGNPTMTARLSDNPSQVVTSGLLDAPEVLLGDCDGVGDVALGPRQIAFDGPLTDEVLEIPLGTHCGVFFVVNRLELTYDQGGALTTLVTDGFDLWVPTSFAAGTGSAFRLRFGDPAWLAEVAPLAAPGTVSVGSDPQLEDAFFAGLDRSGLELDSR